MLFKQHIFFIAFLLSTTCCFGQYDYAIPEDETEKTGIAVNPDTLLTEVKDTLTDLAIPVIVETMPVYAGGDEELWKFISKNIKYPREAKERNKQGIVYVEFTLDAACRTTNVHVVKGAHPLLDAEAVRVISMLKYAKPGTQSGKPVDVVFTLPIRFKLN
ncbi:MAG: hypothetical protein POELPBGB_01755 [Bacteroidia bacterium]|nr:hypothetical protein [Bacteroidia bacterium]